LLQCSASSLLLKRTGCQGWSPNTVAGRCTFGWHSRCRTFKGRCCVSTGSGCCSSATRKLYARWLVSRPCGGVATLILLRYGLRGDHSRARHLFPPPLRLFLRPREGVLFPDGPRSLQRPESHRRRAVRAAFIGASDCRDARALSGWRGHASPMRAMQGDQRRRCAGTGCVASDHEA
jgi:hypothetical protein